ncbi:MAG: copper oxidase, partial [bacterium]
MATRLSRRQILGIGATSLAGGLVWPKDGLAKSHAGSARSEPAAAPAKSQGGRPYWQKTYSGGPVDVAPLLPGLPGDHYKPVVVPNGGALPFKVVGGVKVFHVIADEVDHAIDSGLRANCWGYNGRV